MTVLRALVVEDNLPDATLIRTAIARAGFNTDHVDNGSEAVDMVEETEYHLIITDLNLPDIDGFELIQTFRGLEHGARAKIIAHTAYEDRDSISLAIAHGADDVFIKANQRIHLLETRFRGFANKMQREEAMHHRLEKVEQDLCEVKSVLHRVAVNTEPVRDLSDAWITAKGFIKLLITIGKVLDKTKWVWGPLIAFVVGIKTGVINLWVSR